MAVSLASYQLSASYSSSTTWGKKPPSVPGDMKEQIENGEHIRLEPKEFSYEDAWQSMWDIKETETVDSEGNVTKSVSGGMNIIGASASGHISFQVSASFDSSTYEPGQLAETVDMMAAARAVSKAAWDEYIEGALEHMRWGPDSLEIVDEPSLHEDYQARKEAVARSFAKMVATPLEEQGHAGEEEKIYRSVKAVFTSFEAKYQAVMASVDKNSWMDADLQTATMNLRKIAASFRTESGRPLSFYSLRELEYTAIGVRSRLSLNA